MHHPNRAFAALFAALTLTLTACGTSTTAGKPLAGPTTAAGQMADMPGMAMGDEAPGDGLLAASAGFDLEPATTTIPAGSPASYAFHITRPGGATLTSYQVEQTKQLHLYLVRSDLTGFEHLHPDLAPDGTWTVTVNPATAGTYRVYTQFQALVDGKVTPLVLSTPLTVTGTAAPDQALPAPAATTDVDGYHIALTGDLRAHTDSMLTAQVSRDGQPTTDLQPYLDVYAHLTAFRQGDLAFAHLHPTGTVNGDHGGPTLTFHASFDQAGQYRVFIQFQTAGQLHTAAITVAVA